MKRTQQALQYLLNARRRVRLPRVALPDVSREKRLGLLGISVLSVGLVGAFGYRLLVPSAEPSTEPDVNQPAMATDPPQLALSQSTTASNGRFMPPNNTFENKSGDRYASTRQTTASDDRYGLGASTVPGTLPATSATALPSDSGSSTRYGSSPAAVMGNPLRSANGSSLSPPSPTVGPTSKLAGTLAPANETVPAVRNDPRVTPTSGTEPVSPPSSGNSTQTPSSSAPAPVAPAPLQPVPNATPTNTGIPPLSNSVPPSSVAPTSSPATPPTVGRGTLGSSVPALGATSVSGSTPYGTPVSNRPAISSHVVAPGSVPSSTPSAIPGSSGPTSLSNSLPSATTNPSGEVDRYGRPIAGVLTNGSATGAPSVPNSLPGTLGPYGTVPSNPLQTNGASTAPSGSNVPSSLESQPRAGSPLSVAPAGIGSQSGATFGPNSTRFGNTSNPYTQPTNSSGFGGNSTIPAQSTFGSLSTTGANVNPQATSPTSPLPNSITLRDGRVVKVRPYKVKAGDTLFDIARYELGKASRWSEIYQINQPRLGEGLDHLTPGMDLLLPESAAGATNNLPGGRITTPNGDRPPLTTSRDLSVPR